MLAFGGENRLKAGAKKEKNMPLYEFECQKCKNIFTVVLSLREHEMEGVACPGCGSKKVMQLMSTFIAKTESKT